MTGTAAGAGRIRPLLLRWELVILLLVAAELLVFGTLNPRFLRPAILLQSTGDFVQIGIVALPLALVVIGGGIDVSFASSVGLCAVVFGVANHVGVPLAASLLAALGTGAACGAFNHAMIRLSGVQPLVVTLGSMYLFSGLATVLSGAVGAGGYEGIGGFPDSFAAFASGSTLFLPNPLGLLLVEALALGVLLHRTRFGRALSLCGMNERAALYAGLPLERIRLLTYVGTGIGAAVAGLVLSSSFGSARADLGTSTLLPVVTVVVLGGVSVYGGEGTIAGVLLATLLVGYLQEGLQMVGVPSQVSVTIAGALLLAVVAAKRIRWRRLGALPRPGLRWPARRTNGKGREGWSA